MPSLFTNLANENSKALLNQLLQCPDDDHKQYRQVMYDLGIELSLAIRSSLAQLPGEHELLIGCTVEDADFLASGLITGLESVKKNKVSLACFWNKSSYSPCGLDEYEIAPVFKSYEEPVADSECMLIIVKSIISGACVVATNLTRLITSRNPSRIFVTAPVMLKGAESRLEQHFDADIVSRFEYTTFRIDDEKEGSIVKPGIGGNVYYRYGLKDEATKNRFVPEIVKRRREAVAI
jgi:hypothetical protein